MTLADVEARMQARVPKQGIVAGFPWVLVIQLAVQLLPVIIQHCTTEDVVKYARNRSRLRNKLLPSVRIGVRGKFGGPIALKIRNGGSLREAQSQFGQLVEFTLQAIEQEAQSSTEEEVRSFVQHVQGAK